MKIDKNEILAPSEMVENRLYFSESLKWHTSSSLFIDLENIFLYVILFINIAFLIMSFFLIKKTFPLREKKDIVVFVDRSEDEMVGMTLLKDFDNPSKSIASRMLSNYVMYRENYVLNDLQQSFEMVKEKIDYVKRFSSKDVAIDFFNEVNLSGSKANRFISESAEFDIKINSIKFIDEEKPGLFDFFSHFFDSSAKDMNAQVEFSLGKSLRVADVSFSFFLPDSRAKGDAAKIVFNVRKYSIKRLS